MTALQLWRTVRTPLAAAVNALGVAVFGLFFAPLGLLDLTARRATVWKALPVLWLALCLSLTATALHRLRAAAVARGRGGRGRAIGLSSTARALFYVSAAVAVAPVAVVTVLVAPLALIPDD